MYTIGAAYAGSCEGTMGRVANGFAGDFVLVDPNITKAGEDNSLQSLLYGYVPDVVVVGGEIVHISSDSTVPIIISSPELHRGLTSNRAVDTPICMEGPYIPGKNGSFFHSGNADSVDQDVISAGEKKKIAGKKRATMLCQSVTPISNTTMFSSRPTGSCVCILTGAYLKHQNDLESCGMRLRQASL